MRRFLAATLVFLTLNLKAEVIADGQGASGQSDASSVSYYKQTLRVDAPGFLKALGLNPKAIMGDGLFLGGRLEQGEAAGSGVLAVEDQKEELFFSEFTKVNGAVRRFL